MTNEEFRSALAKRVREKELTALILEIAQVAKGKDLLERRRG
jgi:hypothetical protein